MTSPEPSPFFTPAEVAARWKVDARTIIRVFGDRPDVLRVDGKAYSGGKRRLIRIPAETLAAVESERFGGWRREVQSGNGGVK